MGGKPVQLDAEVRRLADDRARVQLASGGAESRVWEQTLSWVWREEWAEFWLVFFGVLVVKPAETPWPYWSLAHERADCLEGDPAILLLRQEAHVPATVAYAEVTYHPQARACTTAIQNAGHPGVTKKDVERARQGFKLLQEQPGALSVGRKPAAADGLDPARRARVVKARRLKHDFPGLTAEQIAAREGIAYGTLRDWQRRFPDDDR